MTDTAWTLQDKNGTVLGKLILPFVQTTERDVVSFRALDGTPYYQTIGAATNLYPFSFIVYGIPSLQSLNQMEATKEILAVEMDNGEKVHGILQDRISWSNIAGVDSFEGSSVLVEVEVSE